jgi:hypothetical protein
MPGTRQGRQNDIHEDHKETESKAVDKIRHL